MPPDDRPELDWDLLEPGRTFRPFVLRVTDAMVRDYDHVVGGATATGGRFVPPGFAGVLGRRSYLEDHRMPPGGVLLRQSIRWLRPAMLDEPVEAEATVAERTETDGRRKVVMRTVARQDGRDVAEIEMALGWPR